MRPAGWKRAAFALGAVALVGAALCSSPAPERPGGLAARWLGPLAGPAAAWQWVRADLAFGRGETELGLARAELALRMDPALTRGYALLASHMGIDLASPKREPDLLRRRAWLRAALAALERGERSARDPRELRFQRGLLLALSAMRDPDVWPGGERALWLEARAAFAEAARAGHAEAAEMERAARTALEQTPQGG